MRILLLAPQPFYQERGSPIAVDQVLKVLSARGDHVDVLAYHEGSEVEYPNVELERTPNLFFLRNIKPGFSFKKFPCDLLLLAKAIRLCAARDYDLVHAVEEGAYIALILKALFGIPYVYDMDSSLVEQVIDRFPVLGFARNAFHAMEGLAVRQAVAVAPVCASLADDIERHNPNKLFILHDFSLLQQVEPSKIENLSSLIGNHNLRLMCVGNLQKYQGIDLLLEAFSLARKKYEHMDLVIIGGGGGIKRLQLLASSLQIEDSVHFLGARPLELLGSYLAQADVLVSPRVEGSATPMKVYSYLDSGKPVLATDLVTHTQFMSEEVAVLAKPTPEDLAAGIIRLAEDQALRSKLGTAGKSLIEAGFTRADFELKMMGLLQWLDVTLMARQDSGTREERAFRRAWADDGD